MDQLDQAVAIDDLAGGGGDIFARMEGFGAAGWLMAGGAGGVFEPERGAGEQAVAARLNDAALPRGVGGDEV